MQADQDTRSLGTLFADLAEQLGQLLRQEVNLAKTEMTQKATQVGKQVGMVAAGGVVALLGIMAILAGIIIALGHAIPMWLSALIVGLLVAGSGAFAIQRGIATLKQTSLVPQTTVKTIQEDASWIHEQAS